MKLIELWGQKIEFNDRQWEFFNAGEKFVLYGGAKGGGKSWALRWKSILRRWNYNGSKGLLLRRTFPELYRTHIEKIRREIPQAFYNYNNQQHTFTFVNGSVLELGSCQHESDVLNYAGAEYDDICLDEATEFTEYQFNILKTILRTTRIDLKPRMFLGSNPLGVGHGWVKRLFIEQKLSDYLYIPAKVYDNPFLLESDSSYVTELERLPEPLRKAYLEGNWDVFAGQAFNEWNREKHVIESFDYPLVNCRRIIGFDWGFNNPGCAEWLAYNPDGRVYVYREIYQNLKTPEGWAKDIKAFTDTEKVEYIVLPHDCFAHVAGRESIASVFKRILNIPIRAGRTLGENARKNRLAITHQYLSNAPDGRPYLQVHVNCKNLIRTLPELIYDQHNPEDIDTTGEDHAYDALSIALMERIYQTVEAGAVKFEGGKKGPEQWTVSPIGEIKGVDFLKEFAEEAKRRRSTTAIEFQK